MFCFIIKDKLSTTLLCFYYALDNHFTFPCTLYIVFCLIYFSCYSMVIEFYCNIISTMFMLSYYDPSSMCFYYWMIMIVWRHVTSKIIVCYHLPTRDEQELSLGMLIRLKRIYNFWCSMLVLFPFLHVLCALSYTF